MPCSIEVPKGTLQRATVVDRLSCLCYIDFQEPSEVGWTNHLFGMQMRDLDGDPEVVPDLGPRRFVHIRWEAQIMRYSTDIEIDQLIIHMVDPWGPNGLVLSERTLPLEDNPNVTAYFVAHIQNSLTDAAARAARFRELGKDSMAGICDAVLGGSLDLVQGSTRMAESLDKIVRKDRRISPGDLAVCIYRAQSKGKFGRYMGMLKLDTSEVFRHRRQRDDRGQVYVSFETETEIMPSTREKLQKCAFIRPREPRPDYDMMLIDRQVRPPVARFFTEDFLGAELALDARQRTERFYRSLVSAFNQLCSRLASQEREVLLDAIDLAVVSSSVNVDRWLETLPVSEPHKEEIDRIISQELPDREFGIDSKFASRLTQRRRFRGDDGLRIQVSSDYYSQLFREVRRIDEPGAPPYYRIVLHTERWEELA